MFYLDFVQYSWDFFTGRLNQSARFIDLTYIANYHRVQQLASVAYIDAARILASRHEIVDHLHASMDVTYRVIDIFITSGT